MLFDWFLSRRSLIKELNECSRYCGAVEQRAREADERATILSIRALDLEEMLERALKAAENQLAVNQLILSGDPGDETDVP